MFENRPGRLLVVQLLSMWLYLASASSGRNGNELNYITEHWAEFHIRHCGMLCDSGSLVRLYPDDVCEHPQCFECDCYPSCSQLGTCCPRGAVRPDGSFTLTETEVDISHENRLTLHPQNIQCGSVPYSSESYLQVVSCLSRDDYRMFNAHALPHFFEETEDRCSRQPDMTSDFDSIVPYVDVDTGLVFKNKFCAICNYYSIDGNDETQKSNLISLIPTYKIALPWPPKITCIHYQNMYKYDSFKEFLGSMSEDECSVNYEEAPSNEPPRLCFLNQAENYDAFHCDERLLNLCRNLNHTYLSVMGHKNIFCYMCKGEALMTQRKCIEAFQSRLIKASNVPPLTLLLGVSKSGGSNSKRKQKHCNKISQWLDEYGECQPAHCSPGKIIDQSGKCLSAVGQIRGLGYKLYLVLRPRKQQMMTAEDIQGLSNYILDAIADVSLESETQVNITVRYHPGDYSEETPAKLVQITVTSYFVGNDSISRDEYEEQVLGMLSAEWIVARADGTGEEIEITPVLLGEELTEFDQTDFEDVDLVAMLPLHSNEEQEFTTPGGLSSTPLEVFTSPGSTHVYPLSTPPSAPPTTSTVAPTITKVVYTQTNETLKKRRELWLLKDQFIEISHSLSCPYVPVKISNFSTNATTDKQTKMSFFFMGETIKVHSMNEVSMVDGEVRLCTSLYKRLTSPTFLRTTQSTLESVQYYIEVICVSLSVACLFLSSLTYCLFPSLRSLPGMNNLSLCGSLAAAQICLLITARWGVNKRLPKEYCTMHAVFLHYSWLAAFAWMSVCCIHMFRVFTARSNKFTDNRSDKKRFLHYCVYGFGVPALVVIATYAINATVTSGDSSGYNSEICFLDTRRSAWTLALSLLAPLCLVILTNGVMFILTIREIVHVSSLQEHRRSRDRQGVITYVKLSTLTGLLGAVVVVAVQLDVPVVSLFTSPLMALQGVFIFVSFTCNRRVRQLYLDLFRRMGLPCGSEAEKTISTGSSAVRSSSNNPSKAQTASTGI